MVKDENGFDKGLAVKRMPRDTINELRGQVQEASTACLTRAGLPSTMFFSCWWRHVSRVHEATRTRVRSI